MSAPKRLEREGQAGFHRPTRRSRGPPRRGQVSRKGTKSAVSPPRFRPSSWPGTNHRARRLGAKGIGERRHGRVRCSPRARRGAGDDGGDLHGGASHDRRAPSQISVELGHVSNARAEAAPACPSFHSPSDRPSLPRPTHLQTTIMACQYKGGVVLGADSRTSTGTYVANRASDKITQVTDNVWMCRSGSVRLGRRRPRRREGVAFPPELAPKESLANSAGARARDPTRVARPRRAPLVFFRSSGARRRRFSQVQQP